MANATIQIAEVQSREIQKRAGGTTTIYTLVDQANTRYDTFNQELAQDAALLRGQTAEIEYTETPWQKGEKSGVNRNLVAVKAAKLTPGLPILPGQQQVPGSVSFDLAGPDNPFRATNGSYSSKDLQIARAVALKAAVELLPLGLVEISSADEIFTIAEKFTDWLLNGEGHSESTENNVLVKF